MEGLGRTTRDNSVRMDDLLSVEDGRMELRLPAGWVCPAIVEAYGLAESGRIEQARDRIARASEGSSPVGQDGSPIQAAMTSLLLAMTYQRIGWFDQAGQAFERALAIHPHAAIYNETACFCHALGQFAKALDHRRRAVQLQPNTPLLRANLGSDLVHVGRLQEGVDQLGQAAQEAPADPVIGSMWVSHLHYLPRLDRSVLFEEHRQWGRRHAPARGAGPVPAGDASPNRRLRVGFLSPDFHGHSVAYFFEPVLDGRDSRAVEIYGYGNVASPDAVTARLAGKLDHYRPIRGLPDDQVVSLIRDDRIDILVDLAGHWRGHRLGVFGHRPAPIQVTYLGYPDTTGLGQIDYRLTDPRADLPDAGAYHTEQLVFLQDGFLCYRPPDHVPPVGPLPSAVHGQVTFGSFNNHCKVNPEVLGLWARILQKDHGFRLLLKFKGGDNDQIRGHYLGQFGQYGVGDRVTIEGWKPAAEHLASYNAVDIALDTYPYNGTTTTCEALWMGVPTLTLLGAHHCSRVGYSILHGVGLGPFVAHTADEYLNKAVSFATQIEHLAAIRRSLRPMMLASPLCDAGGFARRLETAFRWMWQQWVSR